MTLKEAQEAVDAWIEEYGVRYFSELTNMAVLTEEVGELARIISRRYGDQSWKPTDSRAKDNGKEALGEEMADVLWVLLCLANQTGIDLSTINWWNKIDIFGNTATNGSLTVLCTQNTFNALNDGHSSDYGLAGNNHITLQVVE